MAVCAFSSVFVAYFFPRHSECAKAEMNDIFHSQELLHVTYSL